MIDAFGVERPDLISKKSSERQRDATGGAIAGAGATAAGIGLVGGGIPGVRSDPNAIDNIKRGTKVKRVKAAAAFGSSGIFGVRTAAHNKDLKNITHGSNYYAGKPTEKGKHYQQMFDRGRGTGGIAPETKVIRHLKIGRNIFHGLLAGGAAATAYGVHRASRKSGVSKADKTERNVNRYSGAAIGAGGTLLGGGVVAQKVLSGQSRNWKANEVGNLSRAQRLVPKLKTTMTRDQVVGEANRIFRGHSRKVAEQAGALHGESAKARHFAKEYKGSAKVVGRLKYPALAVAAAGAGGLLANRKQNVKKSAFGVSHTDVVSKAISPERERSYKKTYKDRKGKELNRAGVTGAGAAIGGATTGMFAGQLARSRSKQTGTESVRVFNRSFDFPKYTTSHPGHSMKNWAEGQRAKRAPKDIKDFETSRMKKTRNLYERPGSPGEKAAAGHAYEKQRANLNLPKDAFKAKPGYKAAKIGSHILRNPKANRVGLVTAGAAVGAGAYGALFNSEAKKYNNWSKQHTVTRKAARKA